MDEIYKKLKSGGSDIFVIPWAEALTSHITSKRDLDSNDMFLGGIFLWSPTASATVLVDRRDPNGSSSRQRPKHQPTVISSLITNPAVRSSRSCGASAVIKAAPHRSSQRSVHRARSVSDVAESSSKCRHRRVSPSGLGAGVLFLSNAKRDKLSPRPPLTLR